MRNTSFGKDKLNKLIQAQQGKCFKLFHNASQHRAATIKLHYETTIFDR